jgi:hypothetical protein
MVGKDSPDREQAQLPVCQAGSRPAKLTTGAAVSKQWAARSMREFKSIPGYWLVRGYVAAVARFREQAAVGADSAREVYPPLFEALNWAHSLWDTRFRLVEPQDRHLDGLRYVRDRCHHQLAAAIYPDAAAPGGWRWHAIGHLPPEDVGRGHDREGDKNYTELLAHQPVLETLERVEQHLRSIAPDPEL